LKPDNLKPGVLKRIGKRDRRIEHIAHLWGTADLGNSAVSVSRGLSEKEAQDEKDRGEGGG